MLYEMNKVLFALIGFPLAFLIIIYRERIKAFTGSIGFAEKYLGAGGTYTLYVLLGIIIFFVTLMYITDSFQPMMRSIFGPFFFSSE
jgi:hypothetical protein